MSLGSVRKKKCDPARLGSILQEKSEAEARPVKKRDQAQLARWGRICFGARLWTSKGQGAF